MRTTTSRRRRAAWGLAATGVVAASLYGLGPMGATASSHREAPLIAADPAVDNTDVYAFVSPDKTDTVTFVANWIPFEEPNGGPNFYPFATDARTTSTSTTTATPRPTSRSGGPSRTSTSAAATRSSTTTARSPRSTTRTCCSARPYTLETSVRRRHELSSRIKDAPVAPSRVGPASMPNYQTLRDQAIDQRQRLEALRRPGRRPVLPRPAGLRPAVRRRPQRGRPGHASRATTSTPSRCRCRSRTSRCKGDADRNPVIGVWSTTDAQPVPGHRLGRPQADRRLGAGVPARQPAGQRGGRAGRPQGRVQRDLARTRTPDIQAVVDRVTDPEVPQLIQAHLRHPGTGHAAQRPGRDLPDRHHHQGRRPDQGRPELAAEQRRRQGRQLPAVGDAAAEHERAGDRHSRTGSACSPATCRASRTAAGWPTTCSTSSCRRVEGAAQTGKLVDALAAGDKVDRNDNAFGATFPYVALPNGIAVNQQSTTSGGGGYALNPAMLISAGGAALVGAGAWFAMWWRRSRRKAALTHSHDTAGSQHFHSGDSQSHDG